MQSGSSPLGHPIGIHVSISGKLDQSVDRALDLRCEGVFQIFTCSPRRWLAPPLKEEEVELFRAKASKSGYEVFCHMPYLPNLCSPDASFYSQSVDVLTREVKRSDSVGASGLIVHFGSCMREPQEAGAERVVRACKKTISQTRGSKVRLLLENSASKASVGSSFQMIKSVLDRIGEPERMGVCVDTCHAFASGYDLRNEEAVASTVEELDRTVGLSNVRLLHLNDSKGGLGSGRDRHENIAKGEIGKEGMTAILSSTGLFGKPVVLETPRENEGDDKKNIATTKKLAARDLYWP